MPSCPVPCPSPLCVGAAVGPGADTDLLSCFPELRGRVTGLASLVLEELGWGTGVCWIGRAGLAG